MTHPLPRWKLTVYTVVSFAVIGASAWLIGPWLGIPTSILVLVGINYAMTNWRENH